MHYSINLLILGSLGLFRTPSLTYMGILLMLQCMIEPFVISKAKASRNRVAELRLKHCPFQTLGAIGASIWSKSSVELIWVKSWIPNACIGWTMGGCLASKAAFILLDSLSWRFTEEGGREETWWRCPWVSKHEQGEPKPHSQMLKSGNKGPASTWVFLVFSTCQHQGTAHLFGVGL